ncbi:MAG: DNA repair protein RadC [Ferruginibacter sp.]|nr:DNA repair protein RadC [Ferruginibacter sp.]
METSNKTSMPIRTWAEDDQPRYKLISKGLDYLSTAELLSILLNAGTKDNNAIEISKQLFNKFNNNLHELGKLSIVDFMKFNGVGFAKGAMLCAAFELGRRRYATPPEDKLYIKSSSDLAKYLKSVMMDYSHEVFAVTYLNRANCVKHFGVVSKGGWTGTVADPRMILKKALELHATSIILCHNHPSGNLNPSKSDDDITQKIKQAAAFMEINVLDHIIVSENGYYSYADEGRL